MMQLDLHVHASWDSSDSGLSLPELVIEARRAGLDGVCIAGHATVWDRYQLERFSTQHDMVRGA